MLRFPHVDSRKWNFSPKFRTTWYQLISFKSDFLPFRKFLLTKTKKRKKKNREKFLSIKIALPKKKIHAYNPERGARVHECPERPRTKSGVKLAGKVVQLGSRCRCAGGWKGSRVVHRSFSRVVSGRHTAEARSKPFRLCCLFLGSFLRPLLPPLESIWFWNIQRSSRDPPLLSILPRGCRKDEEFAEGGQRAERYAEAGIRHKSSFSKARPRLAGIEVSNEFPLKFNSRSAGSVKAHRPARYPGATRSKVENSLVELVECKIETSLAIFALDEGRKGETLMDRGRMAESCLLPRNSFVFIFPRPSSPPLFWFGTRVSSKILRDSSPFPFRRRKLCSLPKNLSSFSMFSRRSGLFIIENLGAALQIERALERL